MQKKGGLKKVEHQENKLASELSASMASSRVVIDNFTKVCETKIKTTNGVKKQVSENSNRVEYISR
jgi:hypothetical protein